METLDTLKRLLSSHLESGAVDSAVELLATAKPTATPPDIADTAMILGGLSLGLSIATSLKRIADSMEPTIEGIEVPAPPSLENAWFSPGNGGDLGSARLRDLVEVTFKDGRPNAQWLLGDAIDWSQKHLCLKPIFGAWRPVRR